MDTLLGQTTASGGAPAAAPYTKTATPTTGQTLTFDNVATDQTYDLTPAGTLAALTVTLPNEASSALGQTVAIFSSQTITALTINGATTIRNNPTTMVGGTKIFLRKVRANTWDFWMS